MSADITWMISGVAVSVLAALVSYAFRDFSQGREKRDRDETLRDAKKRITEIGLSLAGINLAQKIDHDPQGPINLTDQLLREIEEEVAKRASSSGASKEEIRSQIDAHLDDVKSRLQAIEERFPDQSDIDKISSINDALFAERIEQISSRIERLENQQLTKWDVAITVSLVVAGIFCIVGATYGVLQAFGQVSGGS